MTGVATGLITAPLLPVPHGFTTRQGGISRGCYRSLNLGLSTGDSRRRVWENRRRVLEHFGFGPEQACLLKQVHGSRVVEAAQGWYEIAADASMTDRSDVLLVISVADCAPLLFLDPVNRAVAAAHAGWRGTAAGIAGNVVAAMRTSYGSDPATMKVAIGPCIGADNYQVGTEVHEAFLRAGFSDGLFAADGDGRYRFDLAAANRMALLEHGLREANIWQADACTYGDGGRFYSHRRDGQRRGAHWAVIRLPAAAQGA